MCFVDRVAVKRFSFWNGVQFLNIGPSPLCTFALKHDRLQTETGQCKETQSKQLKVLKHWLLRATRQKIGLEKKGDGRFLNNFPEVL